MARPRRFGPPTSPATRGKDRASTWPEWWTEATPEARLAALEEKLLQTSRPAPSPAQP